MTTNRQLNMGEISSIQLDRLTIVGTIRRDKENYSPLFMKLLNGIDKRLQVDPYYKNHLYDRKIGVRTEESTAFIELSKNKTMYASDFRLDFNPTKCNEEDIKYIKEILHYIDNKKATRIDIAADFLHQNFSQYHIEDGRRRKTNRITGASGRLETEYRGVRESDDYIKLYDKSRERFDKKWEKVDYEWFRLEETAKGKKAKDWTNYEWFENIRLVPDHKNPIFPEDVKATTKSQAYSVIMGFQNITEFSKGTQTKIREVIREAKFHGEVNIYEQIKKSTAPANAERCSKKK